jgi:hypothetical protein
VNHCQIAYLTEISRNRPSPSAMKVKGGLSGNFAKNLGHRDEIRLIKNGEVSL